MEGLVEQFKAVLEVDEDQELRVMSGGQMKVGVTEGPIKALHVTIPRKVPYVYVSRCRECKIGLC